MDIKWSVGVSYIDLDNRRLFASYTVNAKNKAIAENIGRELFLMEIGVVNGFDIIVEPKHLAQEDLARIYKVHDTIFSQLDNQFYGKNYKEFILAFQQFGGFSSYISETEDSFYWITFMGLTVKIVFTVNGDCYIDTKEVYYQRTSGVKIVTRNNWSEFYYCIG